MPGPQIVSPQMAAPAGELLPPDQFTIRLARTPDTMIQEAQVCAKALMAAVKRNGWAINFGGTKDHLYFEAWSFLASMYRVVPRICPQQTRFIEYGEVQGFEASAEAFHISSQTVVGYATAMCLDDEDNWGERPVKEWDDAAKKKLFKGKYKDVPLQQLRSMAETRASAKVLRLLFSWIVAMAGYAPTPPEEMTGNERNAAGVAGKEPQQKQEEHGSQARLITEKQAGRIWAIGRSAGMDNAAIIAALEKKGFQTASEVTADKYDDVCSFIEKGGK